MTRILLDIVDTCCGGKFVAVLEGGYYADGLAESVKAVLMEMRDETHVSEDALDRLEYEADQGKDLTIRRVMDEIDRGWKIF